MQRLVRRTIQVISDIHLEMRNIDVGYDSIIKPASGSTILVLAGDIGKPSPDTLTPFLDYCCSNWKHVLYVAGNHEFYGKKRDDTITALRSYQSAPNRSNLRFMDRDIVTIDGQRFLGCTLWSNPDSHMQYVINDFRMIHDNGHRFTTTVMSQWHHTDVTWLKSNVQKDDIVITHFMPMTTTDLIELGHKSVYPPSDLDLYYGNTDCYDLKPKLWISGHTHQSFDVNRDELRWVCNPYGYPREIKTYKDLCIDIESN